MEWPQITVDFKGKSELVIGRLDSSGIPLKHKSISKIHAKLCQIGDKIYIEDLNSSFGTYVNGCKVISLQVQQGDYVRFGSSPPYIFKGRYLIPEENATGISMEFKNTSVNIGQVRILNDISFSVTSNEFLGIIGPSGCGKSTLLSAIAATYPLAQGTITFDGGKSIRENIEYFQSKTGIVPQKDLVFDELTVEENLKYESEIKFPELSTDERMRNISESLNSVDLSSHKNKLVGVLSGGQKKRVNVAIELLARPRLLLMDEPTSGLDPAAQVNLMDKFKKLSRQGTTIICVTHTTDTLNFFDKVLVLRPYAQDSGNEISSLVCFGPPGNLLGSIGVNSLPDLFQAVIEGRQQKDETLKIKTDELPNETIIRTPTVLISRPKSPKMYFMKQAWVIARRSLMSFKRDRISLIIAILSPLLFSFLIVASQKEQSNPIFIFFFTNVAALWLGLTVTVREIVKEKKMYIRDKLSGLSAGAYISGKLIYALLINLQVIILFLSASVFIKFITNEILRSDFMQWGSLASIIPMFFSILCGSCIGLIISSLAKTETAAISSLPLILLPQILFSRVCFGHGNDSWDVSSPFGPIFSAGNLWQDMISPVQNVFNLILYIVSIPFITRPATNVMCFTVKPPTESFYIYSEWAYLFILAAFHIILLFLVFIWYEKLLKDWR